MADSHSGWIRAIDAAGRFGIEVQRLRRMVKEGVFTKGMFSNATERPPIFLRVVELEAYQAGGIPAVAPLKAAYEKLLSSTSRQGA